MTTLRVIVDEMLAPNPGGIRRYATELTRALVESAPASCFVEGIVASSPASDYALIHELVPGLTGLHKSALARRELMASWQLGLSSVPGHGMIHAPSLLAPLTRHDRVNRAGDQIAVTIHDTVPWTQASGLGGRATGWYTAMVKRAQRFADAIVVPTHAVAAQLADLYDFGDRIRVIGGAPSSTLLIGDDIDVRAEALDLPARFVLTAGSTDPRKAIGSLIDAMAIARALKDGLVLLVAGMTDAQLATLTPEGSENAGLVRGLGYLDDSDLAVVLSRAGLFVHPSLAEGFGLPLVEAMHFGLPVIHSDDPALVEVAAGAGIAVERTGTAPYAERLAEAIMVVLSDPDLEQRLRVQARDRAGLYTWRTSAEKVWQLHADL